MSENNRREFLADVGRGMLVASVGPALAADLGLAAGLAAEKAPTRLTFGNREPLVRADAGDARRQAAAGAGRAS